MPIIPEVGVPSRLVIRPTRGPDLVICAVGPDVAVFRRDDWDALGMDAVPLAHLTSEEAIALTGFVRYWRESKVEGFNFTSSGANIEFDEFRMPSSRPFSA